MLEMDWTRTAGWAAPTIRPYGPLAMDPAASVLHYGMECFEGMKAYIDAQGKIRLFRPEMNMARLNKSMTRLGFPVRVALAGPAPARALALRVPSNAGPARAAVEPPHGFPRAEKAVSDPSRRVRHLRSLPLCTPACASRGLLRV